MFAAALMFRAHSSSSSVAPNVFAGGFGNDASGVVVASRSGDSFLSGPIVQRNRTIFSAGGRWHWRG